MNHTFEPRKLPPIRNRYLFIADVLLMPLAVVISFLLRLDPPGLRPYAHTIIIFAALAALVKPVIFYLFGLYRRYWRYASANELVTIALATLTGTAVVTVLMYSLASFVWDFRSLPRSIPILDWLVSFLLVGGTRFAVRLVAGSPFSARWRDDPLKGNPRQKRRVLVMGAGDAGAMIVREMRANPGLGLVPVGLLDDDRAKVGMTIHGVPVQGTRESIPFLVREEQIDEVIIAIPTAPGRTIRGIAALCQEAGVAYKTIPGIYELISGRVSVKQVREVRIEDLLRREPVRIGGMEAKRYLSGAVVLVTGAGGSIGAELCRQIAVHQPEQLIVLGHGENSVFHIQLELAQRFPSFDSLPIIADIRDRGRIEKMIEMYRPTVVFHAAAHKHVPLMEHDPVEAITNNVIGARNVAQAANDYGVERFVLISTDKAVNPVNIMGASKRVAELLIQDVAHKSEAVFVAVRFGNVLGSRGSVVPLFQRQIAEGGPVTVTHPEVRRFFMTIPEAVQLVIQAAAIGQGGEIFVLDMGEPVKIVDLATDLIRLSGLEPGRDIDIVFTQLRPGEKLSEELFSAWEKPGVTKHKKILVAASDRALDGARLQRDILDLERLVHLMDVEGIKIKLHEIIPEFQPTEERDAPNEDKRVCKPD